MVGAEKKSSITVYAAASLRETVTEIAEAYEAQTGTEVRTQFGASSRLARRIQGGAPVDVFISADDDWMDAVRPKESFDWLRNRLACITLPGAAKDCRTADTLVLGGRQVPVGKYARAALRNLREKEPERVIEGANVRDVLHKLVNGAGEAGVVYRTDALVEPDAKIVFLFPPTSHPPIVLPAGLLTGNGRGFFEFLRGDAAAAIAERRGFDIYNTENRP